MNNMNNLRPVVLMVAGAILAISVIDPAWAQGAPFGASAAALGCDQVVDSFNPGIE